MELPPRLAVLPPPVPDDDTTAWLERAAAHVREDLDKRVPISAMILMVHRDGSYGILQHGTREAGTLSTIGVLEVAKAALVAGCQDQQVHERDG